MVIVMNKKVRAILSLLIVVLIINVFSQKVQASDIIELGSGSDYAINLSVPGNKTAKWSSSNNLVATVTQKGKVTGKQLGYALIMAETSKTIYYWTIHVVPGEEVLTYIGDETKIKHISEKTKTMLIGESNSFKLYLYNIEGSPTWKSSNKNVATVSSNGGVDCVVTGKKEGKATITATVNGKKYSCKVTVYKKTLYAKPTSVTIDAGKKKKITVRLRSEDSVECDMSKSGIIDAEWGKWDGDTIPLTIEGLREGKTTLTICNDNTKEKVTIKVKVNQGERKYLFDTQYSIGREEGCDIDSDAGKEYRKFHEEWLSEERLEYLYHAYLTNNLYTQEFILMGSNKNGHVEECISYNIPDKSISRDIFKEGVIYEGIYKDTFKIRFQYVNELNLDGENYDIDSICLNVKDLKKAGIIY